MRVPDLEALIDAQNAMLERMINILAPGIGNRRKNLLQAILDRLESMPKGTLLDPVKVLVEDPVP